MHLVQLEQMGTVNNLQLVGNVWYIINSSSIYPEFQYNPSIYFLKISIFPTLVTDICLYQSRNFAFRNIGNSANQHNEY